ncbi:MAG: beta-propeller domain-containing protein [Deltaproteobacteria bacterium]|nr:beta-propeller domain-containing protein [Deltaproteobacteria bacterium]
MTRRTAVILAGLLAILLFACTDQNKTTGPPQGGPTVFSSARPPSGGGRGAEDGVGGLPGDGTPPGGDPGPARAIEEADIVKVAGDTVYALSSYRGLTVIDISNPGDLRSLGHHRMFGTPFEMVLRGGVAYVLFSSFWTWAWDAASGAWSWESSGRIVALDVSDPAAIAELGTFELSGEISDSRVVGDVLYAVAYESGWCWDCASTPQTTVSALRIADPSSIALVDRLTFAEDGWYGGRRSIAVTPERLYVSGWRYDESGMVASSTIQVVDISDPGGVLRPGTTVAVAGQIENRWQMDETGGVLRVVSQPGWWWGSEAAEPVVETFEVVSSDDIRPLGRLALALPRPEDLMSVRFDGPRAYAVTFQRIDPLFLIDLSDPANPVQRGELELPGWLLYLEPRGDRLVALGWDDGAGWSGAMAVSLFDVADLDAPLLIERVAFGGEWGWMPEDQDRIHKAFRVLDGLGLILMPFAGWAYDEPRGTGSYRSGVQLIDFSRDDLALRGVAAHEGFARRAFVHRDALFALSDERLDSYDLADRDNPAPLDGVTLARAVYRVARIGDHVAELVADWWTNEARLEVFTVVEPDALRPVGSMGLAVLRPADAPAYDYWSGFAYWDAQLFSRGADLYLLWGESGCAGGTDPYGCTSWESRTGVAVIDLSDPAAPRLVSQARYPILFPGSYLWWSFGTIESGRTVAQLGSTLVLRPPSWAWYGWREAGETTDSPPPPTLEVLDLSDPAVPRHASSVTLPGGFEFGSLLVDGSSVVTSHAEPLDDTGGTVRFYLDRIDLADPDRPVLAPAVNIPGSPVWFDGAAGRLVTVDYRREERTTPTWEECVGPSGWSPDTWWDPTTLVCSSLRRSLNLLAVAGDTATLLDSEEPVDAVIGAVRVTPERLFVGTTASSWGWVVGPGAEDGGVARPGGATASAGAKTVSPDPRPELLTFTGLQDGDLVERSRLRLDEPSARLVEARGTRAFVLADSPPALALYQAATPAATYQERRQLLAGYGYDVQVFDDLVLSAGGSWGVQAIPLP